MDKGPTINKRRLDEIRAIQHPDKSSLLQRVIQIFEEETEELMSQLENAVERGRSEEVRAAAHKFKSVSGNVGAEALAAWCHELEQKGRDGQLDGSADILDEIRREHGRASAALRSESGRASRA